MQAQGRYYHVDCFRCVLCGNLMEKGQRFAIKENEIYCEQHYLQQCYNKEKKFNDDNNNFGGNKNYGMLRYLLQ